MERRAIWYMNDISDKSTASIFREKNAFFSSKYVHTAGSTDKLAPTIKLQATGTFQDVIWTSFQFLGSHSVKGTDAPV